MIMAERAADCLAKLGLDSGNNGRTTSENSADASTTTVSTSIGISSPSPTHISTTANDSFPIATTVFTNRPITIMDGDQLPSSSNSIGPQLLTTNTMSTLTNSLSTDSSTTQPTDVVHQLHPITADNFNSIPNGPFNTHHRRSKSLRERTGVDQRLERLPSGPPGQKVLLWTVVRSGGNEKNRPVRICDFPEHVRLMSADCDFRFSEEYEDLKNVGAKQTCIAADLTINRQKNRFNNILPYDHSRVKLRPTDDEDGSDYVNASYMPGFNSRREFIASQGPLPSTRNHFWRLVWEQQCPAIVALTKLVEKGRDKCHQYWPDNNQRNVLYDDVEIALLNESIYEEFTIRELRLTNLSEPNQPPRVVQHLHYMAWPDFGVPDHPAGIVHFVRLFRNKLPPSSANKPTIVHCSAGVGRSGTFITLDRMIQNVEFGRNIDVFGTVYEMRLERCHMVQNEQQYIFVHYCILYVLENFYPHLVQNTTSRFSFTTSNNSQKNVIFAPQTFGGNAGAAPHLNQLRSFGPPKPPSPNKILPPKIEVHHNSAFIEDDVDEGISAETATLDSAGNRQSSTSSENSALLISTAQSTPASRLFAPTLDHNLWSPFPSLTSALFWTILENFLQIFNYYAIQYKNERFPFEIIQASDHWLLEFGDFIGYYAVSNATALILFIFWVFVVFILPRFKKFLLPLRKYNTKKCYTVGSPIKRADIKDNVLVSGPTSLNIKLNVTDFNAIIDDLLKDSDLQIFNKKEWVHYWCTSVLENALSIMDGVEGFQRLNRLKEGERHSSSEAMTEANVRFRSLHKEDGLLSPCCYELQQPSTSFDALISCTPYATTSSKLYYTSSLPDLTTSVEDLRLVPSHLIHYRQRIDAGIEEQKRQRRILEHLQDKVQKYRLKSAKESRLHHYYLFYDQCRDVSPGSPHFNNNSVMQYSQVLDATSTHLKCNQWDECAFGTKTNASDSIASCPALARIQGDDDSNLKVEELKNRLLVDEVTNLRQQLNVAINANEALSTDIVHLSEGIQREVWTRHQCDTEAIAERARKQNNAQELLQQRLYGFRIELSALKRRISALKSDLDLDLEAQRVEFSRIGQLIVRFFDQLHIIQESERTKVSKEQCEQFNELLQKYDELASKNIKMEDEKNEGVRQIAKLNTLVHQVNVEKEELLGFIQRLHKLPEMNSTNVVVPAALNYASSTTQDFMLKSVQKAIKSRNSSIDTLKQKCENECQKIKANELRLSQIEAELRETQKQLRAANEFKADAQSENDENKRKQAKLKARLEALESQNQNLKSNIATIEHSFNQHKTLHETELADLKSNHVIELEDSKREFQHGESEMKAEIERLQNELVKTKTENLTKQKENQLLQEKLASQITSIDKLEEKLTRESANLENLNRKLDNKNLEVEDKSREVDKLSNEIFHLKNETEAFEKKLKNEKEFEIQQINLKYFAELERLSTEAKANIAAEADALKEAQFEVEKWKLEVDELNESLCAEKLHSSQIDMKYVEAEKNFKLLREKLDKSNATCHENLAEISRLRKESHNLLMEKNAKSEELDTALHFLKDEQMKRQQNTQRFNDLEQRLHSKSHEINLLKNVERQKNLQLKESEMELNIFRERCQQADEKLRSERELNRHEVDRLEKLLESELTRRFKAAYETQEAAESTVKRRNQVQAPLTNNFKTEFDFLSEENKHLRSRLKLSEEEADRSSTELNATIDKLKADLASITRLQGEKLAEMHESHEQANASQYEFIQQLEHDLETADRTIQEGLRRESNLKDQLTSAESRITRSAEMIQKLYADLEELSEQSESQSYSAEKQLEKIRSELASSTVSTENWRQRYEQQYQANAQLEAQLKNKIDSLRESNERIAALKESLQMANDEIDKHMKSQQECQLKIKMFENQCQELRKKITAIESNDRLTSKRYQDLEEEFSNALQKLEKEREKLADYVIKLKEQTLEIEKLKSEKENALMKLATVINELKSTQAQLEAKEKLLLSEIETQKQKCIYSEEMVEKLRVSCNRVHGQLHTCHEQLIQKKDCNEKTLKDLLEEVRNAEYDKFEAKRELDAHKTQLEVCKKQLEMLAQSRKQYELKLKQNRRKISHLNARIAANERAAKNVFQTARAQHWLPQTTAEFSPPEFPLDALYFTSELESSEENPGSTLFAQEESLSSQIYSVCDALTSQAHGIAYQSTTTTSAYSTPQEKKSTLTSNKLAVSSQNVIARASGPVNDADLVHKSSGEIGLVKDSSLQLLSVSPKGGNGTAISPKHKSKYRTGMSRKHLKRQIVSSSSSSSSTGMRRLYRYPKSPNFSSTVETSFNMLKERIKELEKKLENKINIIQRLKDDVRRNSEVKLESSEYNNIRERIIIVENEKSGLEKRLASAEKAVIVARNEIQTAIEAERQKLRTEMFSVEMKLRDTEERLRKMQDQIASQTKQLNEADGELHQLREAEVHFHTQCAKLELNENNAKRELENANFEQEKLIREKETLEMRLNDSQREAEILTEKCYHLEKLCSEYQNKIGSSLKDSASKSVNETLHIQKRPKIAIDSRNMVELQNRFDSARNSLDEMTTRWRSSKQEQDKMKREVTDLRSRLTTASNKVNHLQALNSQLTIEKRHLSDRVETLERLERECEMSSREKSKELEQLQSERLTFVAEIEDLRRQLQKIDTNRRELEVQLERLRHECYSQRDKIATLEDERRRVEAISRQTAQERLALDKSLAAMEKENGELNRQCSQLQNQLSQLERENTTNNELTGSETNIKKRIERFEAEIHRLNKIKRQLEKTIDQREQNYVQKSRMQNVQIEELREQLNNERKRNRGIIRRQSVTVLPVTTTTSTGTQYSTYTYSMPGDTAVYTAGVVQKFLNSSAQRNAATNVNCKLLTPTTTPTVLHNHERYLPGNSLATYLPHSASVSVPKRVQRSRSKSATASSSKTPFRL